MFSTPRSYASLGAAEDAQVSSEIDPRRLIHNAGLIMKASPQRRGCTVRSGPREDRARAPGRDSLRSPQDTLNGIRNSGGGESRYGTEAHCGPRPRMATSRSKVGTYLGEGARSGGEWTVVITDRDV